MPFFKADFKTGPVGETLLSSIIILFMLFDIVSKFFTEGCFPIPPKGFSLSRTLLATPTPTSDASFLGDFFCS
jgi:hypothetical protein